MSLISLCSGLGVQYGLFCLWPGSWGGKIKGYHSDGIVNYFYSRAVSFFLVVSSC